MIEHEVRDGFETALRLSSADGGRLSAQLPTSFSLAPLAVEPHLGNAHGGLVAALAASAAVEALGIEAPVRTLSLQFLAGARFGEMTLEAELTRGGRSTSFAGVRGLQRNPVFEARLTFGTDGESPSHRPDSMPVATAPEETPESPPAPHFQPRFTGHAEYRPLAGRPLSGEPPRLLLWMRERSGAPIDAIRLCFLLDAIFPAFYVMVDRVIPAASVDLRYDFAGAITEEDAPDGWVLMEFVTREMAGGWAIEDGTAWSRSGRLLATARQLRKTLAKTPRAAI